VRAPTAAPEIRETAKRNDLANSDEEAANANKKKSVEDARPLLCKLTDLVLSGAPEMLPGEAGRRR
jgi:hypothetical protein